jgi:hypothetical protein
LLPKIQPKVLKVGNLPTFSTLLARRFTIREGQNVCLETVQKLKCATQQALKPAQMLGSVQLAKK